MLPKVERLLLREAVRDLWQKPTLSPLYPIIVEPDDERRVEMFRAYRAENDLDLIDGQSMKLLPRVLSLLERSGYVDPEKKRLLGIVKFLFVRSEEGKRMARRAAALLRKSDIRTTAIKGLALHAAYPVEKTLRPMLDVDLVVDHVEEYADACRVLTDAGWYKASGDQRATTFRERWGDRYSSQVSPIDLDLHSTVLHIDPSFLPFRWNEPLEGEPFHVLDRAGMLVVTALHGLRADGGSLWPMDLGIITKAELPPINWLKIHAFAAERRLSLALELAFRNAYRANILDDWVTYIATERATVVEALELRHTTHGDPRASSAAQAMATLRQSSMPITDRDIERVAHRVRWDRRWLTEWQTSK
jgi:hypothetical protein